MATVEVGEAREPPGLGPRTRRSTATRYMDAAGGGEEEKKKKHRDGLALNYVLALRVALPLPVAVSRMDAGIPRKARTTRPRAAKPSVWWAFRLPVPLLKEVKDDQPGDGRGTRPVPPEEEARRSPRPQGLRVCLPGPSPPDLEEKPAKKARRCVQCGSAETPQWRSGPMGRSTLCNACGVRLRAAGALRETEHRPSPATATAVEEKSPESPASDSPPDSPIYERRAPVGDVYLVRKQPKRETTRTPRKEIALAPSPAIYLVKKKKPSKKPWRPRNTGQRCLHCGTTSTPQWREGPMGRHTLCNACGVRYRQGRLLPEYRPAGSPTFVPWEHASRHREVLQLHRQRQNSTQHRNKQPDEPAVVDAPGSDGGEQHNNVFLLRRQRPEKDQQYPPTPLHRPLPQPVDDDPRVGRKNDGAVEGCSGGDDDQTGAPSALDSLLLDGPSAPLIVDGDEFLVS